MSSKLEKRLMQLEEDTPISTDEELIRAIEAVIDEESLLPDNDRDHELIGEAVDAVLSLRGIDSERLDLAAKRIAERVLRDNKSPMPRPRSRQISRLRRLPRIAAALISAIALGTVAAYSLGIDLLGMTKDAFLRLEHKKLYSDGNTSIIVTDDITKYGTVAELIAGENEDLLYFDPLPDGYRVDSITAADYGIMRDISIVLVSDTEGDIRLTMQPSTPVDLSKRELQHIGNYDVAICRCNNNYQAEIQFSDTYSIVQAPTKELLCSAIECLKEHITAEE